MSDKIKFDWTVEEIDSLESGFLHKIFECKEPFAVTGTVAYASYLSNMVKLNPDNYPEFLRLIEVENHWVTDALVGENNIETFFKVVQPNRYILGECFKMVRRWVPGGVYSKNLQFVFSILVQCYENPQDGYRLYPITIPDINNLGKHLDKAKDQNEPLNRLVLNVLDKVASLNEPGGPPVDEDTAKIANQANNIRGKFLDSTKKLNEAIPDIFLVRGDYTQNEVPPIGAR